MKLWNRVRGTDSRQDAKESIESSNARWVVGRIAELTPEEWESLVRAHGQAGRSGPIPVEDVRSRAERIGYPILEVTGEAGRMALEAAGPDATTVWRKSLVATMKGTQIEDWQEGDQRLYEHAWAYMSAAEWAAGFVVARRTIDDGEWREFWSTYRPILGTPPSEIAPEAVLDALRSLDAEGWRRLAVAEASTQRQDGSSPSDDIIARATIQLQRSAHASATALATEQARDAARRTALAAAGPEAAKAYRTIEAITKGTGRSLMVDPRDAEMAERAWTYMDAASNAVLVAAAGPFMAGADFDAAWAPYGAVLGPHFGVTPDPSSGDLEAAGYDAVRSDNAPKVGSAGPALLLGFKQCLAEGAAVARPAIALDAATDPNLLEFAEALLAADWAAWQLIHIRVEAIPRSIDIVSDLSNAVAQPQAQAAVSYAMYVGTCLNGALLDRWVAAATSASDARLAKTWLEILDEQDGPPIGALIHAVAALIVRDGLSLAARAEYGQPFVRCVNPALFGLAEV